MKLLEVQDLTQIFPDGTVALRGVNLTVEQGEFLIIAGRNGSGKTVLARHLNGLLLPTGGRVLFRDQPITDNLVNARMRIGLIFQDSLSQLVGQTVAEDVAFGPENLGLSREEVKRRTLEALDAVGLSELAEAVPQRLSGGQQRRVAIAGVLAMKPELIVFDEPFTGLDYPGVVQVLQELCKLHQNGSTLIVISHDLEKILAHADRMVIMAEGVVVEAGVPAAVLAKVEQYGIKRPYGADREIGTMTWLS